mgnify:CR=1 FL=1
MKKALEWFEMLPEPYRTRAIENWGKSDFEHKNASFLDLGEAIDTFTWRESPQGEEHWNDIDNRALSGEFDKPKPNEFDKPQPSLHGWIPVGERLPEKAHADERGDVLVLDSNGLKSICTPKWVKINADMVKFWQPLPKLPDNL